MRIIIIIVDIYLRSNNALPVCRFLAPSFDIMRTSFTVAEFSVALVG